MAQNFLLTEYLMALQNFLGRAYYDGLYSFPFLFEDRAQLRLQVNNCPTTVQGDNLEAECESLCKNMNLGALSPVIEGDTGFISRATDYFSNLSNLITEKQNGGDNFNAVATLQKLNRQNSGITFQVKSPNAEQYDSSFLIDPQTPGAPTAPSPPKMSIAAAPVAQPSAPANAQNGTSSGPSHQKLPKLIAAKNNNV